MRQTTREITASQMAVVNRKKVEGFHLFEDLAKSPVLCGIPVAQFLGLIVFGMVGFFLLQPLFKGQILFFIGCWAVLLFVLYGVCLLLQMKHPMWVQTYIFHIFAKFYPKISAYGSCSKTLIKV